MKNVTDIFIDIDGTLTNKKRKLSSYTKRVIKQVKNSGINIILCTGRAGNYTTSMSKKVNASKYIISCNGALITDYSNNNIIYGSVIKEEIVKQVFDLCNELKLGVIFNALDKRYSNIYLKRELMSDIKKINNFKKLDKQIYQMVIRGYNLKNMKYFASKLDNSLQIVNASTNFINNLENGKRIFLDITNKKVNKGNAIKEYQKHFKIKKEQCMCFGDHINDITMFDSCLYSIAMSNAKDSLKEHASYITKTNDENGVALFLEQNILRR